VDKSRRQLLGYGAALLAAPRELFAARELACDVAILGGGTGGCAAAVAACRNGMRVIEVSEAQELA